MKINENSWVHKIYLWWHRAKHGHPYISSWLSLCPYARAVLIWAPFRFIFRDGPDRILLATYTTLLLLLELFTWGGLYVTYPVADILTSDNNPHGFWELWSAIAILSAIFHVIVAVVVLIEVIKLLYQRIPRKDRKTIRESRVGQFTGDTVKLAGGLIGAAHSKICPELEVVSDKLEER